MYEITIIQLSGETYFWALKKDGKMIATSELIDKKPVIEIEADEVAKDFGLSVFIEERT